MRKIMKRFNKVMSLVMVSAMAASLFVGCGNADAPADNAAPEANNEAAAPEAAEAENGDAASGTFKIGGIGPTTGSAAVYGLAVQNAAQPH